MKKERRQGRSVGRMGNREVERGRKQGRRQREGLEVERGRRGGRKRGEEGREKEEERGGGRVKTRKINKTRLEISVALIWIFFSLKLLLSPCIV